MIRLDAQKTGPLDTIKPAQNGAPRSKADALLIWTFLQTVKTKTSLRKSFQDHSFLSSLSPPILDGTMRGRAKNLEMKTSTLKTPSGTIYVLYQDEHFQTVAGKRAPDKTVALYPDSLTIPFSIKNATEAQKNALMRDLDLLWNARSNGPDFWIDSFFTKETLATIDPHPAWLPQFSPNQRGRRAAVQDLERTVFEIILAQQQFHEQRDFHRAVIKTYLPMMHRQDGEIVPDGGLTMEVTLEFGSFRPSIVLEKTHPLMARIVAENLHADSINWMANEDTYLAYSQSLYHFDSSILLKRITHTTSLRQAAPNPPSAHFFLAATSDYPPYFS